MKYTFEYKTNTEKELIFSQNKNLFLLEEQCLFSGNFLIFIDVEPLSTEVETIKEQLKTTQKAVDFLLMGGM